MMCMLIQVKRPHMDTQQCQDMKRLTITRTYHSVWVWRYITTVARKDKHVLNTMWWWSTRWIWAWSITKLGWLTAVNCNKHIRWMKTAKHDYWTSASTETTLYSQSVSAARNRLWVVAPSMLTDRRRQPMRQQQWVRCPARSDSSTKSVVCQPDDSSRHVVRLRIWNSWRASGPCMLAYCQADVVCGQRWSDGERL